MLNFTSKFAYLLKMSQYWAELWQRLKVQPSKYYFRKFVNWIKKEEEYAFSFFFHPRVHKIDPPCMTGLSKSQREKSRSTKNDVTATNEVNLTRRRKGEELCHTQWSFVNLFFVLFFSGVQGSFINDVITHFINILYSCLR